MPRLAQTATRRPYPSSASRAVAGEAVRMAAFKASDKDGFVSADEYKAPIQ